MNKYKESRHHYLFIHLYITGTHKNFNCQPLTFTTKRPNVSIILKDISEIYDKNTTKILFCCYKTMTKDVIHYCKKYKLVYEKGEFNI